MASVMVGGGTAAAGLPQWKEEGDDKSTLLGLKKVGEANKSIVPPCAPQRGGNEETSKATYVVGGSWAAALVPLAGGGRRRTCPPQLQDNGPLGPQDGWRGQ